MSPEAARREAIAYYSECWVGRFRSGHNERSHAIHYGMYENGEGDFERAKLLTNDHVAQRLGLDASLPARVIDIGCGVGGTAIHLARRHPSWTFHGVDLTAASLELARELAREAGVDERIELVNANFEEIELPVRFDGAYSIEATCHAVDRARLIGRVHGLLRPRARFVVADLFRTRLPLDPAAARAYDAVKVGFAITDYYDRDLGALLADAGFRSVEERDLTAQMRPGTSRSAAKARHALAGPSLTPRLRAHFAACIGVDELCASGHLAYRSVSAVRGAET